MNVAIFASAFHPSVGGVEELCRQLAHAHKRAGASPIIITNRWPRDLPERESYEGIPLYRIPMRIPEGSLKARVNYHLTHRTIVARLLGILRQHQIDVLHVQCVSSNGHYAAIAGRALKLPIITSAQGERTMDATGLYSRSPFQNQILRGLLTHSDAVTGCSRDVIRDLLEYFGRPFPAPASVIYNGIRLADFDQLKTPVARPTARPYLLAIGRHVHQKGFDVLLRAYAAASPKHHDLVLAGNGPEHQSLRSLANQLGIADRVHFPGYADRPTAVSLFHNCDFFVLPSRMEPLGIVNLEAMAAGKPVIATRTGGVPEIVPDQQVGLLVNPDDAGDLAAAIARLAGDPNLRQTLGAAARRHAERFDWDVLAGEYRDLYASALRSRSKIQNAGEIDTKPTKTTKIAPTIAS